ncbi:hypothetical protein [Ralstonia pseudosolanacearum]|uniref:Uncharacterized protein n=1 Tax=Ralstonia solanacearum TaxID=305 RepID=A0AA92IEE7_RALSL|nr:hypothetical protein [Ralstonia pseudosolanacearum]QCX49695.1 hypothetical protein E7Z57_11695 [Ralstonia pseudosolanacearum]
MLAAQKAESEALAERSRRDHEWRLLLVDKFVLAGMVGLLLAITAFAGNMALEKYKSDGAARAARTQVVRTASDEAWTKLMKLQESVSELGAALQSHEFHRKVVVDQHELVSDKQAFETKNSKVKQDLGDLWRQLESQQLRLGAGVHSLFFRAMQDLAIMRVVYEDQFVDANLGRDGVEGGKEVVAEAQGDLDKRKQQLLGTLDLL